MTVGVSATAVSSLILALKPDTQSKVKIIKHNVFKTTEYTFYIYKSNEIILDRLNNLEQSFQKAQDTNGQHHVDLNRRLAILESSLDGHFARLFTKMSQVKELESTNRVNENDSTRD